MLRSVADCENVCRRLLSASGRWKALLHLPQRITKDLGRTKGAVKPFLEGSLLPPHVQVLGLKVLQKQSPGLWVKATD